MFVGVEGVEEAFVVQPSLHNLKGGISRACGVVGRVLPLEDAYGLFRYVATMAPRYKVADIRVDSKQYCSLVRRRFRKGISFTGPEAREFQPWWRKTVYFPCLFICYFCRIATLLFFCMPPTHAYHRGNGGHWATSMFI